MTPVRQTKNAMSEPTHIASWKTAAHIKSGTASSASSDPWMQPGQDPWEQFKPTSQAAKEVQKDRSYMQKIADNLKEDLQEQMRQQFEDLQGNNDQNMEDDEDQPAITALQSQIQELAAQNETYKQWFQDASSKIQEVEGLARNTQQSLQQQGQEIVNIRAEIQTSAQQTAAHLQTAVQTIKRDIVAELADQSARQFSQLEALMQKKFKTGAE